MKKVGLIIAREYLTRVKKKSFLILTIGTPIALVLIFGFFAYVAVNSSDTKVVQVIDESGRFGKAFKETDRLQFLYISNTLDEAKQKLPDSGNDGILFIPRLDFNNPQGIRYYTSGSPSLSTINAIERNIESVIEDVRIRESGLDSETIRNLKPDIELDTRPLDDEEGGSSAVASFAAGYALSLAIYFFIFLYGAQIMRGVMEEKTNRIVEVVISSVKPLQLLYGKIIGVAAVGLTQFTIWAVLIIGLTAVGSSILAGKISDAQKVQLEQAANTRGGGNNQADVDKLIEFQEAFDSIDYVEQIFIFVFYFLGGYLLYGALFAAVGSAVDSDTDSQQFMLPLTIPLIISVFMLGFVLDNPDGTLGFWLSMFPFTSPVIMMARQPFGVPGWELALSMVLLVGGFFFTAWIASRIYRVGILMHGTKVNYKTLAKWFMQRN